MLKKIILNKKIGQTPLNVIEEYKKANPEYKDIKMAYAGRLDPMAEGELLIVIGEECKNLEQYFNLDKEYVFEILLGFKSDSQDVLGLAESDVRTEKVTEKEIQKVIKKFTGKLSLPYPIFSSKTVKGKKLFLWTLENRLHEIKIPKRDVEIYELIFLQQTSIKKDKLKKEIFKKINSIKKEIKNPELFGVGFRKSEILGAWEELFKGSERKELGQYGIAYSINRTKIY